MNLPRQQKNLSPGSLGDKIKKIRNIRGLSQKELGLRCGFSEATAAVRIRQYEDNQKTPREKALQLLADALDIDISVFYNGNLYSLDNAAHAFFDLEEFHGLYPVKINGEYYLKMNGKDINNPNHDRAGQEFLRLWYEIRNKYAILETDSKSQKEEKEKLYELWKLEYPMNEAVKNRNRILLLSKKERLEKQLKEINEQLDE